jgi:hypothetical protein
MIEPDRYAAGTQKNSNTVADDHRARIFKSAAADEFHRKR